MDLSTLLKEIGRPCTVFDVGEFRPTGEVEGSWLGRVFLYEPHEEVPVDKHGKPMMQLGQFYLPTFPFVPDTLSDVALLTVFISDQLEGDSGSMNGCWEVREYRNTGSLIFKTISSERRGLKPFPLRNRLLPADHPVWDGGRADSRAGRRLP